MTAPTRPALSTTGFPWSETTACDGLRPSTRSRPATTVPRGVRPTAVLLAVLVAGLLVLLAAGPAFAHAALVETDPFDGQVLDEAPDAVTWTFNEPVVVSSGALRVFDASGERVDTGQQSQPGPAQARVALPPTLPQGTYIATFRVTSADGHVVRGAGIFAVGQETQIDDDTLAAIFGGDRDAVIGTVSALVRTLGYLGALLLGAAPCCGRGWWRATTGWSRTRARRWTLRGGVIVVVTALATVPVHAMATSGLGLAVLVDGALLRESLTSSVGVSATVRFVAAAAVVALLSRLDVRTPIAALAGVAVLGSFLLAGHTRTVEPAWVMYLGDAAHLGAAATWFGGLVLLAQALRTRRADDDDPVAAANLVRRFSGVATWSVLVVTAAGFAMSWALVREPRALTSTEYGSALILKTALVGLVLLVALYNNRRLVPAITGAGGQAWDRLRRTVRFEVGVLVAVVVVTGVLVNLRPAAEAAGITGAFDTLVAVSEDLQVNLVVDPNRAGFNEIHLYVFDRTGRTVTDLDSFLLRLSMPDRDIGPIERTPFVAGPGHWQLDGRDLAIAGEWEIEIVIGVDRFTEERVTIPVVVNN
jgi:copper transport protein